MTKLRPGLVAGALVLDALFGEPPVAVHPTVLMGRTIAAFEKRFLAGSADAPLQRLAGLGVALALPALSCLISHALLRAVPRRLRWPAEAALLSTALSMRGLAAAALAVGGELERGDLPRARTRVGEIVGRDTDKLSPAGVARAAVETVAENTSDGVVAPMLYGVLFGAPGALAYKATNTLDSMLGHPDPPYTHLGLAPARLDDLANLLPARLTVLAAAFASGRPAAALDAARRYGPLTRSPNAGRVEAAFAGALSLSLGGANSYGGVERRGPILGDGRPPAPADVARAVRLMRRACLAVVVGYFFVGSLSLG